MRTLEFELAYLSLLTSEGLKPLSRWEKPFDHAAEDALHQLGLKTRVVERSVQVGRPVRELLLSTSAASLEAYATRFAGSPVTHDADTVRLEGRLFGYPSCCVESFAARGYARNSLRHRDQRILFHWACPGCAVTPLLIAKYRRVYDACRAARRGQAWGLLPDLLENRTLLWLRPRIAAALSLAVLGVLPATLPLAADPLDPHVTAFVLADDPDTDFLLSSEEILLEMDPAAGDQNTNSVPDGVDLARALSSTIDALPTEPSTSDVFLTHHLAYGLETCRVCGTSVNMGFATISNPQARLSVNLPYIALHYLEHDSFSFAGDVHGSGRTAINTVTEALFRPAVRITADPQQVELRWQAKAGRIYQIFAAADPQGPWSETAVFEGDDTEKVFSEPPPAGASKRFYRVVVR